ncbi:hypothetical protein D3C86_814540 [compost metagenome]
MEQVEPAGIAVEYLIAVLAQHFYLAGVLLEYGGAYAVAVQQAPHYLTEAAEAGDDDGVLDQFGLLVFGLVGLVAVVEPGLDHPIVEDQQERRQRHRERHHQGQQRDGVTGQHLVLGGKREQHEGELPPLCQRQGEGPTLARRDANDQAEHHQHPPFQEHQPYHQGWNEQGMGGKEAKIDASPHRHEEEAEQQPLERLYVRLQLVAILAVRQHHAGEEGAKGGGEPHRLHQHGDGDHQQQGGGDEDLPHVGLGYGTEHRPHQVVAAQHYAGDGGDHQQAVLPARQIRIAVTGDRRYGEQREYGQYGNDGDVLEQQHREGGAPALALHQFALLQALQHYGGGGERQNKPDGQPLLQRQTDQVRHASQSGGSEQHLQAAGAEDGALQLPQEGRTQLEADQEQHQHHPELGEVHHILLLPHQPQQEGAYDDARQQVTEH